MKPIYPTDVTQATTSPEHELDVLLDIVPRHTSIGYPWFREHLEL